MFLCQNQFELFYLEDRYFPRVNRPALFFFWKAIHNLLQLSTYKNISRRVNWFNKLSYKNLIKISVFSFWSSLFFELANLTLMPVEPATQRCKQVDRERGANQNQSRGIQLIHAKRLTHHPNTRYTLLVMDSWQSITLLLHVLHIPVRLLRNYVNTFLTYC